MIPTATLLAMTPKAALIAAFNDATGQSLPQGLGVISDPVDLGDGQTQVTLSVRQPYGPDEYLTFSGGDTFTYERLDLTRFFGALLADINPPRPCTTEAIISAIHSRFGIVFDHNDFIIDELTDQTSDYILKPTPKSLRWVGQLIFDWVPSDGVLSDEDGDPVTTEEGLPIQTQS